MHSRRGLTLIELMAVLAMLGLLTGVVGVAIARAKPAARSIVLARMEAARRTAVLTGTPVFVAGDTLRSCTVLYFPDGSAIGSMCTMDSVAVTVDPLTGAARVAR